jgi:hypothetical protein
MRNLFQQLTYWETSIATSLGTGQSGVRVPAQARYFILFYCKEDIPLVCELKSSHFRQTEPRFVFSNGYMVRSKKAIIGPPAQKI